jgi:hypothetical protein
MVPSLIPALPSYSKMSKYNPFSHYEDHAMPPALPIVIESEGQQFTIAELLNALRVLLVRHPELAGMPVFHAEYGGILPSRKIEVPPECEMMIIDQ